MWMIFGGFAIIATIANLYLYKMNKSYNLAMAIALSFTALTLMSQYQMVSDWTVISDWTALMDVTPFMSIALWVLTLSSIVLNITPIFLEMRKEIAS